MRRPLLGLCLTAAALTAQTHAATPFPNGLIPGELVRLSAGEGQFFKGLPDNYPLADLKVDASLAVLGHLSAGGHSSVVFTSPLAPDDLTMRLAPPLLEQGWTVSSHNVNVSGRTVQLCHAAYGTLNLSLNARSDNQSQLVATSYNSEYVGCDQMTRIRQESERALSALTKDINAFVPADPRTVRQTSRSGSYTPGLAAARAEFSVVTDCVCLDNLMETMETQLGDAGWQALGIDVGGKTAIAIWKRTVDVPPAPGSSSLPESLEVRATATLALTGDDQYLVSVRMQSGSSPHLPVAAP